MDQIYFDGQVDAFLKNPDNISKISTSDLHTFKMKCLEFYVEITLQIKKKLILRINF
jgi:hypothetical protein